MSEILEPLMATFQWIGSILEDWGLDNKTLVAAVKIGVLLLVLGVALAIFAFLGLYVGAAIAALGVVSLIVSAIGFLVVKDPEGISFQKPLIVIGVGVGIMIASYLTRRDMEGK